MFATKPYYTAGHVEIRAQANDARPQISSGAIVHELRTYQLKTKYEVHESWWKNGILLFISAVRFHPPSKERGISRSLC